MIFKVFVAFFFFSCSFKNLLTLWDDDNENDDKSCIVTKEATVAIKEGKLNSLSITWIIGWKLELEIAESS